MYKWGVTVARWILQLVFGLEVEGLENIPSTGGAVVAANHTTWFDPHSRGVCSSPARPFYGQGRAVSETPCGQSAS